MKAGEEKLRLPLLAEELGLRRLASEWKRQYVDSGARDEIRVVVLGEFNHGKSSLINALIGEKVLPYGVTPTTKIDTYVRFGADHRHVHGISKGGKSFEWTWEEYLEISRKDFQSQGNVHQLDIYIDKPLFDTKCVFVDTPGMNEAFVGRENYLGKYLGHANIILFLIDASQALTHSEQAVLEKMSKCCEPHQTVLVVINKCDSLDDDEMLDVCAYVEKSITPWINGGTIYMVSSKRPSVGEMGLLNERIHDEVKLQKANAGEMYDAAATKEMHNILLGFVALLKHVMRLDHDGVAINTETISDKELSVTDLDGIIGLITRDIDQVTVQITGNIARFSHDFIKAMPREIDKSSIMDTESFFEDFVDEEYCEKITQMMSEANETLSGMVSKVLDILFALDGNVPVMFDDRIIFDNVRRILNHPVRTGAFDDSRSMFWMDYGVAGMLSGRVAHARKYMLKKMASVAIERRAEQYTQAFVHDLGRYRDYLLEMMRMIGPMIRSDVREMVEHVQELTMERVLEIEEEIASGRVG